MRKSEPEDLEALHKAAVRLLEKFGLDHHIRMQLAKGGQYRFKAWETPAAPSHNGGRRKVRRGTVDADETLQ